MHTLIQDIRFALRMIVRNPAFAGIVVVTLALGIGANTAIFSLVNAVVLRPAPFPEPDRLMWLFRGTSEGAEDWTASYLDYVEYRDRSDVFENLAAFSFLPVSIGAGDACQTRFGQVVTGNYFQTLDVQATLGRMLEPSDDETPGGHPVTVLNHRYWQQAYGGDPGVIGKTIVLSDQPFTIVGVAPEGFSGAMPAASPALWVPMMMLGQVRPDSRSYLDNRGDGFLLLLGRLRDGLEPAQAQARISVTASQLKEIDPDRYEDEEVLLVPPRGAIPMTGGMRQAAAALSTLVMSMVVLVLLVACANVANLNLARSMARRTEIGIRLALGAGRLRLVRQLLTESILLALLGGALGLLLAAWTMDLLVALQPELPFNISMGLNFALDGRIFTFTAIVSLAAGIVFGLLPAWAATKADLVASLKDDVSGTGVRMKRNRLRSSLVVAQVALSFVLLIGAGLFVRSLLSARAIDPGFDHENVLAVALDLGVKDWDESQCGAFCDQLLEEVRALPGVEAASLDTCPPLTMTLSSTGYWIEGRSYSTPDDERVSIAQTTVSSEHFRTLGIPLLCGRDFSDRDTSEAPPVAIVNQALVDRFWPGEDPLGKRISSAGAEGPYLEIVGVAGTARYWLVGEDPRPFVYRPLSQRRRVDFTTLLVRATGDPMAALPAVRAALRRVDPNVSPMDTRSFTDMISFVMLPAKFAAALFALFGVLALILASVGLYGVMSYSVARRTHEIGVRTAIGAGRGDVIGLVLRQGLTLTLIGLAIGLALSLASTHVVSGLLYDVSSVDPVTFIGVAILMVAVALLACYVPARRASRVDPMIALRCE